MCLVLSLSVLIATSKHPRGEDGEPSPELPRRRPSPRSGAQRTKIALCIVCLLAYIVVMPWIGFILSTVLFILAFALALEERRSWS